MKKIALYCRVSTALQEQEKTIESQLSELRDICRKQGHQVLEEYVDNGWSGSSLQRPALDRLRDDASRGFIESLYIYSPDRLARDFVDQGIVIRELEKSNVEIVFFDEPLKDDINSRLMFGVKGLFGEYERRVIAERMRRGRMYKLKSKGILGGTPPFGYTYIKKTSDREGCYKINESETRIVRLIFDLYIQHNSSDRVIKELTLRGLRPRHGLWWSRSTVGRILKNEAYIGRAYYNKNYSVEVEGSEKKYRKIIKTGRRPRSRKEWILVKIPPILENNKFLLVQELKRKSTRAFGGSKNFYLVSGLTRCSGCGSTFVGDKTRKHRYYRCTNRLRRFPLQKNCSMPSIKAEELEKASWKAIERAVTRPRVLTAHIYQLHDKLNQGKRTSKRERAALISERSKISIQKERLLDAFVNGIISKPQLSGRLDSYSIHEQELTDKLKKIEDGFAQESMRPLIKDDIKHFCNLAKQRIKKLTLEQKRQFLYYLVQEIQIDSKNKKAKIKCSIPFNRANKGADFPQLLSVQSSSFLSSCYSTPTESLEFEINVSV